MEDSNTSNTSNNSETANREPLGMSSFSENERQQFGQNIRIAMACIEGKSEPTPNKAMPVDAASIGLRLKALSQNLNSSLADLLELLVRFDDLEGWKESGAKHCAAWMNSELGISIKMGWEYRRVGRKLRLLPTTTALFRAGKLTWSKVRLITRVADLENEKTLCHAALDASVSDVERLCCGYRWNDDEEHDDKAEKERAVKQQDSRALTWNETSNGCTQIKLVLPPELAQAFLNSVEHSLNQLNNSDSTITQRRADAAVLMAESSLQYAGKDIATADRYQVIVSVDESALNIQSTKAEKVDSQSTESDNDIPKKRPTVKGAGPIAFETARRIACDCCVSTHTTSGGNIVDIGRKSRIWPNAMARTIKDRDQHCQFPGCSQSQHLQIHHVIHWADGGTTCVENGACLCTAHHTMVHEGGYTIQRVDTCEQRLNEQFTQQQHSDDLTMFDFEKNIRNDQASFDKVRKLSPTRYRFRIVDAEGRDISAIHNTGEDTRVSSNESVYSEYEYHHSHPGSGVAEPSARYFVNVNQPFNVDVHSPTAQHEYDSTFQYNKVRVSELAYAL